MMLYRMIAIPIQGEPFQTATMPLRTLVRIARFFEGAGTECRIYKSWDEETWRHVNFRLRPIRG
jgi:hypothetical protein